MEMIVILLVMIVFFWWMSRNARKQQQRLQEERDAAIVVGANVVTQSGFLGTIVDIDGDAVTLESPSGIETVWVRSSIAQAMDIPVAEISEEDAAAEDAVQHLEDLADEDTPHEEASAENAENTSNPMDTNQQK